MKNWLSLALLLLTALACLSNSYAFQTVGGRVTEPREMPSKTTPRKRPTGRSNNSGRRVDRSSTPNPPQPASLMLTVNPPDSIVLLNNQQIDYRNDAGRLTLTGLKPDSYKITVRKTNYIDYQNTIFLSPGESGGLTITLKPQPGTLTISPSIANAEMTIINLDDNSVVGNYTERIKDMNIGPGRYQIAVTKPGYRTALREIIVKPAGSVYLEVPLEILPVEKPPLEKTSSEKPRGRADAAMALQVSIDGKYLVANLIGQSGEMASPGGSVKVMVMMRGRLPAVKSVNGLLPGFPCQVELVKNENIEEASLIEWPKADNQWKKATVRIRPTDPTRAIRFSINWKPNQVTSAEATSGTISTTQEPAVAIQRVSPAYPAVAKTVNATGKVVVLVEIDEQGNVTSASAIEGPKLLRKTAETAAREWKFRPARRDGRPIKSTQSLIFNF